MQLLRKLGITYLQRHIVHSVSVRVWPYCACHYHRFQLLYDHQNDESKCTESGTCQQSGKSRYEHDTRHDNWWVNYLIVWMTTSLTFLTFTAFLVAWTPYSIFALSEQFGDPEMITPSLAVLPALIAKSSICYNPLIYVGMNSQVSFTCQFA